VEYPIYAKHKDDDDNGTRIVIGSMLLSVIFSVCLIYLAFANDYVCYHFWKWFIVPTFGLKMLTIPQSIGLNLVVGFLSHTPTYNKAETDQAKIALGFVMPWISLLSGFIVKCVFFQ